jgi:hypothetical protein
MAVDAANVLFENSSNIDVLNHYDYNIDLKFSRIELF